jgi:hypothetical protein
MNAWSLLYEELDMSKNIEDGNPTELWRDNGDIYITGGQETDTINFSSTFVGSGILGGMGDDHITFESPVNIPDFPTTRPRWKYDEEQILKELSDYISGTYNQHYSAGTDKVQTLDLIEACGDGESFCRSNILKYASRYDKKGTARRDILKILHYAVLLLHFNDKNAQRETYPQ